MFDTLPPTKISKSFTKHLTNLSFVLGQNELKLLYYLISESKQDNTVKVSKKTLFRFHANYKLAKAHYKEIKSSKPPRPVPKTYSNLLKVKQTLIDNYILIPLEQTNQPQAPQPKQQPKKPQRTPTYIINPAIAYDIKAISPAFYIRWLKSPQDINQFLKHANNTHNNVIKLIRNMKQNKARKKKKKFDKSRMDLIRTMSDENFATFRPGIDSPKAENGVK